jgi:hypothetical protein
MKPKLLKRSSVIAGTFVPSLVLEGFQQLWKRLVVTILKLQPRPKPPFP